VTSTTSPSSIGDDHVAGVAGGRFSMPVPT
jgi:hypothetical protein